ncbi:MAG: N-acetylglucosaminyl-diphospho-decaprenol L-rhamnosyltransferase [Gaiellaceae bacterium]|nr:N-acetylglucosaminyl-diphospho-decaprenol L-rhamnosyltransferase [Gaiellaceae bacterium]
MSRVCAIIVTYNSADSVEACVAPLLEAGADVIVVDNASADGTAQLVSDRLPGVDLIANQENRGFPAAVNQGAARALSNTLLLVNPDCVVPAETVRALDAFLEEHPDVGLVGPRLREADGSIQISAHPLGSFSTLLANRARRVLPRGLADRFGESYDVCLNATEPTDVGMMIAACVAIRRDLLEQIGGLDEGYFMYLEDMELCLQVRRAGYRVVYLPTVEARHVGGASSGDRSHVWPHHSRSLLRFHARHRPRTYQLVRATLIGRAVLGMGLGLGQDALAAARHQPPRRKTLAWARVAGIAVRHGRSRAAADWRQA